MHFGYTEFNKMQYRATDVLRVLKVNTFPRSLTSCLILNMYFGVFFNKTFEGENSF
jgi:hypothetical protein